MAQIKKVFIVCGEPSGDLLAGSLAGAMRKIDPAIEIAGVGGDNLAKSARIFYDIKGLAVMGFFDVIKKLPRFLKLKEFVLEKINSFAPDCLILVDFSGFNLRLAAAINKKVPVVYYVSPQVWASRPGRIVSIKKFISLMVVLFKFEEDFYRQHAVNAAYAGHPLVELIKPLADKADLARELGLNPENKIIALLPGSRKQEIKLILPVMLSAASRIRQKFNNAQFIIAKSPSLNKDLFARECQKFNLDLKIIDGRTQDCLKAADAAMVCSGTATLEAAIIQNPFVIVYKTGLLNYLLYRPLIKIPFIGMVNIVAQKSIVPEFIQGQANPEKISASIVNLLENPEENLRMRQELKKVKDSLGEPGAAARAARMILDFLNRG